MNFRMARPTIRRGGSFDISFCTETLIPRRSTPSSCALIPMVVLMQVASAVANEIGGRKRFAFTFVVGRRIGGNLRLRRTVRSIAMQVAGVFDVYFDHDAIMRRVRPIVMSSEVETSLISIGVS